jgi:class 3 adenylate cyclase
MSEATLVTTTIMFADICRSTYLFNRLGDAKATILVGEILKQTGTIVEDNEGVVLRSKGDDVLCIFSKPQMALQTSMDVHKKISEFSTDATGELSMKIGINSGSALLSRGDIQGDSVNIAARLSSFAKAGQTIVSSPTIEMLDGFPAGLIRPVGEISLKGKPGPVSIFEILDASQQDEITQVSPAALQFPKSNRLTINYQSRLDKLDYLLVRYLFGRNPDCDLVLDHPLVSRHHAEIRYQNDGFVLIDFSTNGTELIINGRLRSLHHSQAALRGSGSIFLGHTVYNRKYEIAFHADTPSR